jgi:hypothetical protein
VVLAERQPLKIFSKSQCEWVNTYYSVWRAFAGVAVRWPSSARGVKFWLAAVFSAWAPQGVPAAQSLVLLPLED